MFMKKLLLSAAVAALGMPAVASAHPASQLTGTPILVSQSGETGEMTGSMMNGMSQQMSGTIVDLLSYVTRRTASQMSGNGSGNSNKGAKLPRPLGLVSQGQVYLIEITPMSGRGSSGGSSGSGANQSNSSSGSNSSNNNGKMEQQMESRLSGDIGKTVNVMGKVYHRGGVGVVVIGSVM